MAKSKTVIKTTSNAELLSYIINQNPVLKENLDLPVQGQSIEPIGKLIMGNKVYRNAFINTINLIGLTVIKRNGWENPWDFTKRGTLRFGQHVREMIADLCNVYDYNANFSDKDRFLQTVVPNVLSYIHEINLKLNNMTEIGLKHINQYIDLYNETEINKSHYIIQDKQT